MSGKTVTETYKIIDVVAAVIVRDRKILIGRRRHGKKRAGYWEFPGGKIQDGELPEECLAREILEELNILIEVDRFLASNVHYYSDMTIRLQAYSCRWIDGDLNLRDHDIVSWVSPNELEKFILAPADIPIAYEITQCFYKNGGI